MYNLMDRDFETNGLRDAAQRQGLGVLPYYALASGFLTGKYRPGTKVLSVRAPRASGYLDTRGEAVLEVLDEVSAAHEVAPAAVAIAWLRAQPTVVAPIASASRPDQLPEFMAGGTLELAADELAALADASQLH